MKTILMLEDNAERIEAFQRCIAALDEPYVLKIWRDAPTMTAECVAFFPDTVLICLDYDLNPQCGVTTDPGTGRDVALFLCDFLPVSLVLIHSSNTDLVYSMQNDFRFAGWTSDRVGPIGTDWIETTWFRRVRELLAHSGNTWRANLPEEHADRIERMGVSLTGLALGDALGEMLSYQSAKALQRLMDADLPAGPWFHTDDTEMAISIFDVLKSHGTLNQDALARRFARRFERDPDRGYGKMTRIQLREVNAGAKWQDMAAGAFSGQGSMGNGGAMRVPPLGAYFAEDLDKCVEEAKSSALVTHTHPEGVAGTIAAAIAAAMAWRLQSSSQSDKASELFCETIRLTPDSKVRRGILLASQIPREMPLPDVVKALGNGALVTAPDTVPLCIWIAAHNLTNFLEAVGTAIIADGDCDTNAAIVGGIVSLSVGKQNIPEIWLESMEQIKSI